MVRRTAERNVGHIAGRVVRNAGARLPAGFGKHRALAPAGGGKTLTRCHRGGVSFQAVSGI